MTNARFFIPSESKRGGKSMTYARFFVISSEAHRQ